MFPESLLRHTSAGKVYGASYYRPNKVSREALQWLYKGFRECECFLSGYVQSGCTLAAGYGKLTVNLQLLRHYQFGK